MVSSGNGEIIDGTPLSLKSHAKIYASRFMFDENDVACWPSFGSKLSRRRHSFYFRINKDAHDLSDDKKINEFVP